MFKLTKLAILLGLTFTFLEKAHSMYYFWDEPKRVYQLSRNWLDLETHFRNTLSHNHPVIFGFNIYQYTDNVLLPNISDEANLDRHSDILTDDDDLGIGDLFFESE